MSSGVGDDGSDVFRFEVLRGKKKKEKKKRRKLTHDARDLHIYPTPTSRMRGSDSVTLEDRSLCCFVLVRLFNWVSSSLI